MNCLVVNMRVVTGYTQSYVQMKVHFTSFRSVELDSFFFHVEEGVLFLGGTVTLIRSVLLNLPMYAQSLLLIA